MTRCLAYPSRLLFAVALVTGALSQSLNLSEVLERHELNRFSDLIQGYPSLFSQLEQGNVTILAPTDAAFATYSNNSSSGNPQLAEEILQYHVLQGIQTTSSLNGSSTFLPTLLFNASYTNVTGGQVVEATGSTGKVLFLSALKAVSNVISADNFYGTKLGLLHVIDAVMSAPQILPETVSAAKLVDLVALANQVGLLGPAFSELAETLFSVSPDVTYFAPNSAQAIGNRTAFVALSQEALLEIVKYQLVNSTVLYSTLLTNGSTFQTVGGKDVTVTIYNGSTYINAAKVLEKDLLTANGVMQITDSLLDPNNTSARPNSQSIAPVSSSSSGLSTGAKAGIGVGVALGFVLLLASGFYIFKRRRSASATTATKHNDNKRHANATAATKNDNEVNSAGPSELHAKDLHELHSTHRPNELGNPDRRYELDGQGMAKISGAPLAR